MVAPKLQPFEIRELADPDGGLILELRASGLRLATARASADRLHELATTQGLSRDDVRRQLESSLSDLRLVPELKGQVFGYWFGPGEEIPGAPVGWPTGAILPPLRGAITDLEVVCLDLVPVHNYWLVLSELGRYTYRHTAGLLNGEEWRFAPVKEAVGMWPMVLSVGFADSIATAEIEARYGFEASTRTRLDAPAVQLRLRRL
ncbi:MAG TPA: hypothetical protein VHT91_27350 [Kofleriaceae bacterium]|nr:hypothetical protein [Kofleriaceae bacterium]